MKDVEHTGSQDGENRIAIIGMAGRFPGAADTAAFWRNLREGIESVRPLSEDELRAAGVGEEALSDPRYVRSRPVLDDIDLFDARFFGYSPKMAAAIDPQFRLFLECAWSALEDAGYDPDRHEGPIGLHCGASLSTYLTNNLYANPGFMADVGEFNCYVANLPDSLATRVGYKLNLKGACYTTHTFCSTALVNVHTACQSLLNYELDLALAGGVSVFVPQGSGYRYEEGLIVSPDGHCRPFDAAANGTVFGSGLGVVVLKRLEEALTDGDTIHAVILGSATNNDGNLKVSYTAPSVEGQARVIAEALAAAGVEARTIDYVETHGTGTALGDPTEIAALHKGFGNLSPNEARCALGSVKSNFGHLDAASGIAGLIKTVLMLKHGMIPPTLHFKEANPEIDFDGTPFHVNAELSRWEPDDSPRRAGVSSFGVGGTNVHVVLEEAPKPLAPQPARNHQLLVFSARTATALESLTSRLADHFGAHTDVDPADAAFTLQVGRRMFNHRRALVCAGARDAATALRTAGAGERVSTMHQEQRNRPVVFLFTGQGSQYPNMGRELYASEPLFRACIDRCAEILRPELDLDPRDVLYPAPDGIDEAAARLAQTALTQPLLFAIEYAVSQLWMSWGIKPDAVVGHSIGEYVAACVAGVMSLEDGLRLVAARGRLIQNLPAGGMLAVRLTEAEVLPYLDDETTLATINSPVSCVVSGPTPAIERLESKLSAADVQSRRLHTSHAFHSVMMEPIMAEFEQRVGEVDLRPPGTPFLSNVTGGWIEPEEACRPSYWSEHLRRPVRFSDSVVELLNDPSRVLLEVGPGNTLVTLVRQHRPLPPDIEILSSLRHPKEERSDMEMILSTLGRLWLAGCDVDWAGFHGARKRRRVPLPTYPFERQRHWVAPTLPPRGYPAWQAGLSREAVPAAAASALSGEPLPESGNANELTQPASAPSAVDHGPENATAAQRRLAEIWGHLLGMRHIELDDNYFELGGDSVLAVRMFTQIEKVFGKRIPLSALLDKPTIRGLAPMLEEAAERPTWSCLVPLNANGTRPPLFLMHSHGGNVLEYYPLAHRLGPDQPVYALQALGLNETPLQEHTVEQLAAAYLEEIRTVQPGGPYILGGFCFGGLVAWEAARQLRSAGETVDLVILINASIMDPNVLRPGYTWLHRCCCCVAYRVGLEWSNMLGRPGRERWVHGLMRLRRTWDLAFVKLQRVADRTLARCGLHLPRHTTVFDLEQLAAAHDRAWLKYKPQPYDGRVLFFRARRQYMSKPQDPFLGWQPLLTGEVERHDVPGFRQNMLDEHFVGEMADIVRNAIER